VSAVLTADTMDLNLLQKAVATFQTELFNSISSATYGGTTYENGQKAKEALIRSQSLIMNIHECVKISFSNSLLTGTTDNWDVYPPIGRNSPELKIHGLLKGKNQDLVFSPVKLSPTTISDGPNAGEVDEVGAVTTSKAVVVGVRSQMSSVDKNFDTLMERAFAETLNLRLRTPILTMGEVYLLPLKELDDKAMLNNKVLFKSKKVNVAKFVKIFNAFSNRASLHIEEQYKYDSSALVLIDLEQTPAAVISNGSDLKKYGYSDQICNMFDRISPLNFDERLLKSYKLFQSNQV
jgi:hypothetical protein